MGRPLALKDAMLKAQEKGEDMAKKPKFTPVVDEGESQDKGAGMDIDPNNMEEVNRVLSQGVADPMDPEPIGGESKNETEGEGEVRAQRKPRSAPFQPTGEVEVFDNIPIPETRVRNQEEKYPWNTLEVGKSFFVPGAKAATFHTLCTTRNKREAKNHGENAKQFKGKAFNHPKTGEPGVMVWRIK